MDNTSGQGKASVVPPEIKKWNLGAFLLSWLCAPRMYPNSYAEVFLRPLLVFSLVFSATTFIFPSISISAPPQNKQHRALVRHLFENEFYDRQGGGYDKLMFWSTEPKTKTEPTKTEGVHDLGWFVYDFGTHKERYYIIFSGRVTYAGSYIDNIPSSDTASIMQLITEKCEALGFKEDAEGYYSPYNDEKYIKVSWTVSANNKYRLMLFRGWVPK